MKIGRRWRMGLVGGGPGAFIGPVHRLAAELDGEIELVAGAFSRDAVRSAEAGAAFRLNPARAYPDLHAMLAAERARSDGIDFVAVATPNRHHLPAVRAALAAGLPVFSDKPMAATLAEAREIAASVAAAGLPYALAYTYSGYPLVREARARVGAGALGDVRKVVVEYLQGWLAQPTATKQAAWRLDPAEAGDGGCVADIGVHAFHLAEFVAGRRVAAVLPDLAAVVPGRTLDDDASVLLRFEGGARGALLASQIATGERNGLRIRVYGSAGALDWRQERPDRLRWMHADGRIELIQAGDAGLDADTCAATRLPGGHPEGYLEAFANLYRDFGRRLAGLPAPLLPDVAEGLRSMAFVHAVVHGAADADAWRPLDIEGAR